jgi:hypothetical protein
MHKARVGMPRGAFISSEETAKAAQFLMEAMDTEDDAKFATKESTSLNCKDFDMEVAENLDVEPIDVRNF